MRASLSTLALLTVAIGCGHTPTPVSAQQMTALKTTADAPVPGEVVVAAEGDWPWWRGPGGNGVVAESAPTSWSKTEHVKWTAPAPGRGHSSPTVCGDAVLMATADEQAREQRLLCYDRATGALRWNKLVHAGGFMKVHPTNSQASATVACDGERAFVQFNNDGALWVSAFDLAGEQLWQVNTGPYVSQHGVGASPVIYKSSVIVCGDNQGPSYVAALDRATGEILWRTPRDWPGQHSSYGSPIIMELAGRQQLLLHGHKTFNSYDPDTGALLWTVHGPAEVSGNTPAFGGGLAFASAGYPEHELLAIEPDGSGDVSESKVRWRSGRGTAYVPSPLYLDGRLYVLADEGVLTCFNAEDGEQLWRERLGGNYTASPILAGDHAYLTNESGVTSVYKVGDKWELVAKNDLGSGGMATLSVAGGEIFVRTGDALYCIAE